MTAQIILHQLIVMAVLFISSLLCQPTYGQSIPEVQANVKTQELNKIQELGQTKELSQTKKLVQDKEQEQAHTSPWNTQPGFLAKNFHCLKPDEGPPIVLDNNLRRPFLFLRDAVNQRWQLGRLFFIMMLSACLTKVFAKKMVAGAQERCRKNFLVCLASAFIYTTILLSSSRMAFQTDALVPMALACIAIVQLSYIVGIGLGVNIFANTLSDLIGKRFGQESQQTKKKMLGRWFALVATVSILTAIAAIPELGRLPRLGNRLVVLVAIIGLGCLISDMRTKSRNRESE